jgi:hypothetical protein
VKWDTSADLVHQAFERARRAEVIASRGYGCGVSSMVCLAGVRPVERRKPPPHMGRSTCAEKRASTDRKRAERSLSVNGSKEGTLFGGE